MGRDCAVASRQPRQPDCRGDNKRNIHTIAFPMRCRPALSATEPRVSHIVGWRKPAHPPGHTTWLGLVNVLYILDEPSIGLHQSDNHRLIESLKRLRDASNSIIVVEHDKDIMLQADYVPKSTVIIGGGVIGLEFASILNAFSTEVTVVEMCPEILPGFDRDIAKRLRTLFGTAWRQNLPSTPASQP